MLSWIILVACLFAPNLALAAQDSVKTSGSWSGVIINSGCTVDEAFAEAGKCTDNVQGTRLVLYDDTTRQIYDLDPQGQAVGHLGEAVNVHGALEANTIHVASLECLLRLDSPSDRRRPHFQFATNLGGSKHWRV